LYIAHFSNEKLFQPMARLCVFSQITEMKFFQYKHAKNGRKVTWHVLLLLIIVGCKLPIDLIQIVPRPQ